MKKTLLLLFALLTGVSGAWADSKISKAVAGTYLFDSNSPALTVNKGGATITSDNGAIVIHHDDLSYVDAVPRTYAAVVMKVDMPTISPSSFSNFINLKASSHNDASIGLGVTTEGKLKGTWQAGKNGQTGEWNGNGGGVVTSSAVTGEHTIVMLCNNGGTTIYVDGTSTSVNNSGLKGGTKWTDLRIESAYASCVKSVYVFSGDQASNISAFFSELSNVVTVANSETKSVSENSTATRFFVASGGTLTADAAYDMDKIEGAGYVTVDANLTISGNIATIATGKLTINEGKTLTLGAGDSQTNSIESFSSIDLCGTIYHNNKKATLNNVTVPSDKTGKIFAFDMGADADAFKLAGTTTLTGNLTILSRWNAQIKVDELSGDGTWKICGTTGDVFDDTKTQSSENAIFNIANASSFTGSAILNNSKATANLAGTCHVSSLSGLAILNVASGYSISAPSVPNTMTLTGAGDVVLTTFPTSTGPNLSSWTGAIEFPENASASNITDIFNAWGNENSTIKLNDISGYFSNTSSPVNPTLNILKDKTLTINNGFSDNPPVLSKLTGEGDVNISWAGCRSPYQLTVQRLEDFNGTLKSAKAPIVVEKIVLDTDPTVDDLLIKTSCTGEGTVTLENLYINSEQTTAYSWETKTVDEVNGIYVSAFDQVQQYRERADAAIVPYFSYIGAGVGKYTVTLGSTAYTNASDLEAAISGWATIEDCADPTITLNTPSAGFYRFKAAARSANDDTNNWYMGSNAGGIYSASTTASQATDVNTIFYLEQDVNGYHPISFFTGRRSAGTEYHNVGDNSNFTLSQAIKADNTTKLLGEYKMVNGSSKTIVMWSNETLNAIDGNNDWSGWTIEEVESLPVTIGDAHYATFSAPVAVTVPEGVTAYKATSTGEDVMYLAPINSGNIIPANMGVILYAETPNTYNFDITTGGSGESILNGTTAAISWASGYYTLQKTDGGDGVGLYGNAPTNSSSIIPGFKAYYNSNSSVKGFRFNFRDENGVKTLEEIQGAIDNNEIFDMSGRRIAKAARGLYIVNGKKLLVK